MNAKSLLHQKSLLGGKSAGPPAKQSKPNPPAPAAPQEVAQTPPVAAEGMEVVTDGTSTVQPSVEQGGASGGSSQPTPSIPPLFQTPNPPNPSMQNQGAGACPTQGGRGQVVTTILGNRVLLMCPLVGMEATFAIAGVRVMVKPFALGVKFHIQAGSEPAPSVMRMFAEVIVMRVVGIVHLVSKKG